ncbi:MAG: polysaccharide deacetylase family protein [Clostridia bacterium]|nr:polysaccharide deacetylase family protein [Clostridia bacterium]
MQRIIAIITSVIISLLSIMTVYAYDGEETVYYCCNPTQKLVALTFDDGPHKYRTDEILDLLEKEDIKATFFVVGMMAKEYPDVIKRTLSLGHEIGNHTYNHSKLRTLGTEKLKDELVKTEEILYEICEYRPKLFRPPEGWCSQSIAQAAHELDYDVILWNIDTLDWAHNDSQKICKCITDTISPGSIILFHDYVSGDASTLDALKQIIPELKSEGYRFVTVSQLISSQKEMV